jgi:hypothetical protein
MYLSLKGSLGHTAITDRVGESLLQIAEGSSAAYSLRNLGSDSPSVVRVRRESDNAERDFTAQDINTSVVENWVNQQIIPPLDLRELTPTGRDGPLIEATAAYSLRSLGTNQWSYGGDTVTYTSDFSAGTDGWNTWQQVTAASAADPVDTGNVLKVTVDTSLDGHFVNGGSVTSGNIYSVSAQVYVPSSNAVLDGIAILDSSGGMWTNYDNITTDQWVNIPTSGTAVGQSLSIRGKSGTDVTFQGNGTDVFYIRNVVVTQTLGDSNDLPAGKYVTQVRRTSDNQVRSFTATEVSNGTLLAWVNADVDKLDLQIESGGLVGNVTNETATGFDFSVNNEGSVGNKRLLPVLNTTVGTYNATFDVVVNSGSLSGITLTRISNDNQIVAGSNSINLTLTPTTLSGAIYFRTNATAVADVSITNITLTQTSADGHVSTWYDQSGNTNHATQATAASQPKIVDAGVLVTGGIDFDGSSHFFDIDFGSNLSQPNSIFMVHQSDSVLEADNEFFDEKDTTGQRTLLDVTTAGGEQRYRMLAQNDLSTTNARVTTDKNLVVGIYNGSNSSLSLNGNVSNFTNSVGGDSIARLSAIGYSEGTNHYYDGKMDEFIIYNSDQSNNRTAFEANIGEVYSITGIPAYDNTVNGFVEAWYDQSGNGYDAVQLTASNQPKVVDAGVLVAGGIDFDGAGQKLNTPTTSVLNIDGAKDKSIFAKGTFTIGESFVFLGGLGGNGEALRYRSSTDGNARFEVQSTGVSGDSLLGANGAVYSSIFSGTQFSDSDVSANGLITEAIGTLAINSADTVLGIGYVNGSTSEGSGQLSELIIYPSDESAKRAAIEDNIDNHYGITSTGSYVNAAGDSYINAAGDTYLQP